MSQVVQLHAGVVARPALAGAPPAVGGVGAHPGPGAGPAAGAPATPAALPPLALLPRPAHRLPAVAGPGRAPAAARPAAHGAAGAAEHAAPRARAAHPVPLPGAGRVGGARRAQRGHLPLHAQAAAGLRARPARLHGLYLGQDHRCRPREYPVHKHIECVLCFKYFFGNLYILIHSMLIIMLKLKTIIDSYKYLQVFVLL